MTNPQIQDIIRLLIGGRAENFPNERAIRLYQFQIWTLFPNNRHFRLAGLTAATKLLERIQDDIFVEQEDYVQRESTPWEASWVNLNDRPSLTINRICALGKNSTFHAIFNTFIADLGGPHALLNALPPSKLDENVQKRIEKCSVVTNLIDYRFRYVRNIRSDDNASDNRHAKFFMWWPTRKIAGGRGVRSPGKAPSTKTTDKWLHEWELTATFLYLNDHCGFRQFPAPADDELFTDHLLESANDCSELKRFFGAYAFVQECLNPEGKLDRVLESIPRVAIDTAPFTQRELATLNAYEDNHFYLDNYLPEDND
jgi:hypothetical protein